MQFARALPYLTGTAGTRPTGSVCSECNYMAFSHLLLCRQAAVALPLHRPCHGLHPREDAESRTMPKPPYWGAPNHIDLRLSLIAAYPWLIRPSVSDAAQ